jgi:hypothetical protein
MGTEQKTVGGCTSIDELCKLDYNWNAVVDAIYRLWQDTGIFDEYGKAITDWRIFENQGDDTLIMVRFYDQSEDANGTFTCHAKFLFMDPKDVVEEWNKQQEIYDAENEKRERKIQYRKFLELKKIFEPEADNETR